jgi:hypothetical protein
MVWLQLAVGVGLALVQYGVQYYRAKKLEPGPDDPPPGFDGRKSPTVTESDVIPVLFGTKKLSGPNVLWYGPHPQQDMFSWNERTKDWRVQFCLMMSFCHGPIDRILGIEVGGRYLPQDYPLVMDDSESDINFIVLDPDSSNGRKARHLFDNYGPGPLEGGLQGLVRFRPGYPNQQANPYLASISSVHSGVAYRGLFTVILEGHQLGSNGTLAFYHGSNPEIKPWAMIIQRIGARSFGDGQWYAEKADIAGDMNPAHIIRETLTDESWGLGLPESSIDVDAFETAADSLYADDFGLSLLWSQQTTARQFILEICRHIDGLLFEDPASGKWVLRLIRDDYDVDTIPALGPSDVISVSGYARPSWHERTNMLSVIYSSQGDDREKTVTLHDGAGIALRGEIPQTIRYPGITKDELANRVASRDLRAVSVPLATVELVVTRDSGREILPGDVILWSWPEYGIVSMVLRVVNTDRGTATSSAVTLQCSEDAFAWQDTIFADPPGSSFVEPFPEPEDAQDLEPFELPLYLRALIQATGFEGSAWDDLVDDKTCRACLMAKPNTAQAVGFEFYTSSGSDEAEPIEFVTQFARPLEVEVGEGMGVTDTSLVYIADKILEVGDLLYFPDTGEILRVSAVTGGTATVERGLMDTTPSWEIREESRLYAVGNLRVQTGSSPALGRYFGVDIPRTTTVGSLRDVYMRALIANAGTGSIEFDAASEVIQALAFRSHRPYPPGDTTLTDNGTSVDMAWNHRNRILYPFPQQSDFLAAPEAGVEYELKIYEESPTPRLLRTVDTAATSYSYTAANESADRGGAGAASRLRFELRAVRDASKSATDLSYYAQIRKLQR